MTSANCRFVIAGAVDSVEEAVDAMMRQHRMCQTLWLLGGYCHRPARCGEGFKDPADARVQPALGDSGGHVVFAVPADHLFQAVRRYLCHVEQGIAQLGADHRVEQVLAGNREPQSAEGRGNPLGYATCRVDKSAVQVKDHGHCC